MRVRSQFTDLSLDVIGEILIHLHPELIFALARTCRQLYDAAYTDALWRIKFQWHFQCACIPKQDRASHEQWFDLFIRYYQQHYQSVPLNVRKLFSLVKENQSIGLWSRDIRDDLNVCDGHGVSLLTYALTSTHQPMFDHLYKLILKKSSGHWLVIDPEKQDTLGRTILHWAILFNQPIRTIASLVSKGCSLDVLALHHGEWTTVLHMASIEGRCAIAQWLHAQRPALLYTRDHRNNTPLGYAVRYGHADLVQYFLESGADAWHFYREKDCLYPLLCLSIYYDHLDIAYRLLEYHPRLRNPVIRRGYSRGGAIHLAVIKNDLALVKMLLLRDLFMLEMRDYNHDTPLIYAARMNQPILLKYFLDMGANVIAASRHPEGFTALHWAILNNHMQCVNLLLNSTSLLAYPFALLPPLHLACRTGSLDIVQRLVETEPHCINMTNCNGHTAIMYAAAGGFHAIVGYLISNGADMTVVSSYKNTLLHLAAFGGHVKTIKLLLAHGIDVAAKNFDNHTASDMVLKGIFHSDGGLLVQSYLHVKPPYVYELKLLEYEKSVSVRPKSHHRYQFFKYPIGFSAGEKLEAVQAVKKVVFEGEDASTLEKHYAAIQNGQLHKICSSLGLSSHFRGNPTDIRRWSPM